MLAVRWVGMIHPHSPAEKPAHTIHWRWLKGHAGHKLNERCDELAGVKIAKLRQESGPKPLPTAPAFLARNDQPVLKQAALF